MNSGTVSAMAWRGFAHGMGGGLGRAGVVVATLNRPAPFLRATD